MKNVIKPDLEGKLPATHDRGSGCIDLLAISAHCDESAVIKCGYLPFYLGNPSDHWGYNCDIDIRALFDHTEFDLTSNMNRRFCTDNVKKCNTYVNNLEEGLRQNKICEKIEKLEQEMVDKINKETGCIQKMIKRCKNIFEKQLN